MIIFIVTGMGVLVIIAIIVGVMDARQGPMMRLRAAERRRQWEAHHVNDAGNCDPKG